MSDLSINGPGSPISLKKVMDQEGPTMRELNLFVDGTGAGIAKDDPSILYITPKEREEQCRYYVNNIFNGTQIPAYLYRYLQYMMTMENIIDMKYPTDQDLVTAMSKGDITTDSEEYKIILNYIKYSESNPEVTQIIGLIQCISGALKSSSSQFSPIRIYIEHPEHALHPKRQSRFMSMMMNLRREYEKKIPPNLFSVDKQSD